MRQQDIQEQQLPETHLRILLLVCVLGGVALTLFAENYASSDTRSEFMFKGLSIFVFGVLAALYPPCGICRRRQTHDNYTQHLLMPSNIGGDNGDGSENAQLPTLQV